MRYKSVMILCEGETEELFVKHVMDPYLKSQDVYTKPVILGGVSHYAGIKKELLKLGKNSQYDILTTMLDYYKLPQDVPGVKQCKEKEPVNIARYIEKSICDDLKDSIKIERFIPYIQMHEFEALLFSNIECFEKCEGIKTKMINDLRAEISKFLTPEHVNNSEQTAPSKRIKRIIPSYQKTSDGMHIARAIGIETMIKQCPHFAEWIEALREE